MSKLMQANNVGFIKFLIGFYCLLFCVSGFSKPKQANDTLILIEFEKCKSTEEKMNWLYNNELPVVYDFIKKHPAVYDTFSKNVIHSQNGMLIYQHNLMEAMLKYHQNKFQKAIPLLLNILNQKKYVSQNDSVKVIVGLKLCFVRLLNYPKVLEMHHILMDMARRNPSIKKKDLGVAISNVYINMGLISEGIKYLRAEYYNGVNQYDEYAEANFYNNLGVVWQKGNRLDSATFYYKKAQAIINDFLSKDPSNKYCVFFNGLIDGNMGQILMAKGQYVDAIPLLKKDIYSSLNYGNLQNAAISYNELALCFIQCKKYIEAERYLDSSLQILKDIDAPHELLKNLKLRAKSFFLMGKYKEAASTYQEFNKLSDSLAFNDKELLLINQQVAHQTNELQQKIEQQQNEMLIKNQQEVEKSIQRILLIVLLICLFAILVFGYISLARIKKREYLLSEKNEEITHKSEMLTAALKEKELLIKEVHHRVKNNMQIVMSLLKLQAEKINDKNIEIYFSEARSRIQSMALIHEFLYKKDKMDLMQMDEYIKQLINEIKLSYAQPNHIIELHIDLDKILLDFDTAIPLGLIINELVTNAYKHAFPNKVGNIWVTFKKVGNMYSLTVKDNGIGLPIDFEQKKENSLGMELIQLLSTQINAQLEIVHQQGFEVKINFGAVI